MRILALHGYTQNAYIFSSKMGAIRKSIPSAEFVFVDAPNIVHMPTNNSGDFDSTADSASSDPTMTPRAWWFAEQREDYRHFRKLDETMQALREILDKQGPFDAVWGFSQGAACAAILTAVLEKKEMHDAFASCQHAPFKFAVLSAGFLPTDPRVMKLFVDDVSTPSLHILGRGDTIVGDDRSLPLAKAFKDARIEWHDGGHHTPSKASWRTFFRAYCEAEGRGSIPGPSGDNSAPPSRPESRGPTEAGKL